MESPILEIIFESKEEAMKTIYLHLCLLYAICGYAQDYLPLPTTDAEWTVLHEQISSYEPRFLHNYHYVPQGDTLINGETFVKLYRSDGRVYDAEASAYVGAYRNEDHKVLYVAKDSLNEAVLYDFEVQPGWILSIADRDTTYFFQLESIDTIVLSDNLPRRRYNFHFKSRFDDGHGYHHSWIEGMGSTIGFFPDPEIFYMHLLPVDPIFSQTLLCFKENGALLYTDSAFYKGECFRENMVNSAGARVMAQEIKVFPNPSGGIFHISLPERAECTQIRVLDLRGRVVLTQNCANNVNPALDLSNLPNGLYILEVKDEQNALRYWQELVKKG